MHGARMGLGSKKVKHLSLNSTNLNQVPHQLACPGRGRTTDHSVAPAQIPAGGITAPGSCLR